MNYYLRFSFNINNKQQQEELLANLVDWEFDGFEETSQGLVAYIPEDLFSEDLKNYIETISKELDINVESQRIEPQNWNSSWEKEYEPVVVEDFCAIRAHFHEPIENVQYEILITPKMSFGTGHHATTYMCVDSMKEIDFAGQKVLDYGSGTGILAILAARLGAAHVDAVDIDYWAYDNCLENIQLNQTPDISVFLGDWESVPTTSTYDIILANINRNVILADIEKISQQLNPGGYVLTSGYLFSDESIIVEAAQKVGLTVWKQRQREQWLCICFVK